MLKLLWERKKLHIVKDIFVLGFNHSSMWVYLKEFPLQSWSFHSSQYVEYQWILSVHFIFEKKWVFQKPPLQEGKMGNVQCKSGCTFVRVCTAHAQTSMCERFSLQKQTRCLLTGDEHVVWTWCIYTGYIRLCKSGFKDIPMAIWGILCSRITFQWVGWPCQISLLDASVRVDGPL